jgi:HlyD family secretion protein
MKKVILVIIGICVLTAGFFFLRSRNGKKTEYTFVDVTRGKLENTVSSTGALEPVTTIQVGTQVSGIIDKIYVDFNDKVHKGQLMAVIDTTILSVQVRDARANLLRAQAQYDKAKYDYERTEKLFQQKLLSELEFVTSKSDYQTALASLRSSETALERANRNIAYAFIRSPIDGTVIDRKIEEGQTVASSFQTPELFLIAEDLSKMEIHAQVDESDIGQMKPGLPVRFEVQAYDDKVFTGSVRQVWLQPTTTQNVVNYTVVIDAANPDGLLLPGMTTTVDFIVEEKENVLMVANAALKITPTEEMTTLMRKRFEERFRSGSDSSRHASQGPKDGARQSGTPGGGITGAGPGAAFAGGGFGAAGMRDGSRRGPWANRATLWYLDDKKQLQFEFVRTGMTDGKQTELIPMREDIKEGLKVISSIGSAGTGAGQTRTATTSQRNIFQQGPGFGPPR